MPGKASYDTVPQYAAVTSSAEARMQGLRIGSSDGTLWRECYTGKRSQL